MNNTITNIINDAIGKLAYEAIADVNQCLDVLFPYISQNYAHSRECVQHAIVELYRINDAATVGMLALAVGRIRLLSGNFETAPSNSISYISDTPQIEIRETLEKISPLLAGKNYAHALDMRIADSLSPDERRAFVDVVVESVKINGLKTEWSKDAIESHLLFFHCIYPICVKDDVMDLFYNCYYNFLDRLATSGNMQAARDCAENLLMIGYDQNMIAEAYYGASRAYTAVNNHIAGLFYFNFSLYWLEKQGRNIPQRLAFEILWQYLKIMRTSTHTNLKSIDEILNYVSKLNCASYDKLSIHHTALSIRLNSNDSSFLSRTIDFLDSNREDFFANIEHSAVPWLSLIASYRKMHPKASIGNLSYYEDVLKTVIEREGNEKLLVVLGYSNQSDIVKHLKEVLVKLQKTRSIEDYAHDNKNALILAKLLLTQAVNEDRPEDYVLAMRPKSDFTFVMNDEAITTDFAQLQIDEVDGDEYSVLYCDMKNLSVVTGADENDIIIWIGKGTDSFYCMKLIRGAYSFDKLEQMNNVKVSILQHEIISKQYYQKSYQPDKGPIYIKPIEELEEESSKIKEAMKEATFEMPNVASRCLIAKDIEIASIPHQLMIDARNDSFIGEMMPTCNIISTELLIKSNFEDQLPKDYTKSFWLPIESGEFTFEEIKGRLGDVLEEHGFSVTESVVPDKPVTADLNIVCAHGGSDIGETQWFYANDKPIVETQKIVGKGRVLVLFVCHSGSMLHTSVDNAMHTIVKRYLRMGYSAVVAPMWSLATDILPCWLSKFMASINTHEYVIDAVYKANMAVKSEYTSVSAWGCMHLFGNPYVQINEKPRLQLKEDGQVDE